MLLYFKTKTCIQIEHSNIKLIFITYLKHQSKYMTNSSTPILLLTGYLGSGKTTLVNKILNNRRGIRFAVIVNDIGEVNIDADLIAQGGIVGEKDESLVALQNGCICCSLKMDLISQLHDIMVQRRFDYIVIEASGICEPGPIAQTIETMPQAVPQWADDGFPQLDCIVSVVDALRLKDEFCGGNNLLGGNFAENDIENLVIQQIEFCNIILLNKASEVTPEELSRTRSVLRALQPKAQIVECDYCEVDFDRILHTHLFNFGRVATSAAWIDAIEKHDASLDEEAHHHHHHDEHEHDHEEEHDEEAHGHHHHHHDDHEHGHDEAHDHNDDDDDETLCPECGHHHHHGDHCCCGHHHGEGHNHGDEYGISTFVYYRRPAFDINAFDQFVARLWPKQIIRAKGICYFADEPDSCYLFEQAGSQVSLRNCGQWYAKMPEQEREEALANDAKLRRDWDEKYGDRMQKIVFIGQHMDQDAICTLLDACLAE